MNKTNAAKPRDGFLGVARLDVIAFTVADQLFD